MYKHTIANNDRCEFGFLFSFGTIDKENLSKRVSDNKICSRDSEDLPVAGRRQGRRGHSGQPGRHQRGRHGGAGQRRRRHQHR